MSVFGATLVRIFLHSGSISPYSIRMRENTDQNNSEYVWGHSKRTSPQKWQFLDPPPPMSTLITISGYPSPPCHRVNSDKLSLRIQVTKTIWGHFKNSNDSRNYDKSALFFCAFWCVKLGLACLNVFTNKLFNSSSRGCDENNKKCEKY